ncbi:MAG TPA: hypothetical protein VJ729_02590 [Nitrososphaeraceae archaeon]|nr:hypothetical protein [Nitrososphaeraceae archaeon]
MGYLIILRGPAGAGKTTVSKCLIETLGSDKTFSLDLDITLDKENEFSDNLNKALGYENVVGMMFWGLEHTQAPQQWIDRFKDKGYVILSVILHANLETLVQRVKNRGYDYKDAVEMRRHFNNFEKIKSVFANKARVEEVIINHRKVGIRRRKRRN